MYKNPERNDTRVSESRLWWIACLFYFLVQEETMPISTGALPVGVVEDILFSLPVKSLLRFKSVRHDWGEYISSKGFITRHLNHHQSNPNNVETVMMTVRPTDATVQDDWDFSCIKFDNLGLTTIHQRKIECPLPSDGTPVFDSDVWFQFLGSCNGLVCLQRRDHTSQICIWNPATGVHRVLDETILTSPYLPMQFPIVASAFGFDAETMEYKFVRIFYFHLPVKELGEYDTIVEVCSFGEQYCRCKMSRLKMKTVLLNGPCQKTYTSKNNRGIFSWLAIEFGDRIEEERVVSFDMSYESLQVTHLPSVSFIGAHPTLRLRCLSNIDEHVALTLAPGGDHPCYFENYDVWLLGEYGVKESWNMIYSIELGVGTLRVIGTRKNGVVLMESVDGRMLAYCPWTGEKVHLPVGRGKLGTFQLVPYIESLVPLTWVSV